MDAGRGKKAKALTAIVICFGATTVARADAGVPMLAIVWPASWILLLPIIAVEGFVAARVTALGMRKSLLGAAVANAVSTILALPVTWGLLVVVEMVLSRGGRAFGLSSAGSRVFAVTVQAPWLIPYESDLDWMVPLAALVLLIPFFFASVFTERLAFKMWTRCDMSTARRWSWCANAVTYGAIFLVVAIVAVHAIAKHDSSTGSGDFGGTPPNKRVNASVRPVTALANCASAAPVRPARYAQR